MKFDNAAHQKLALELIAACPLSVNVSQFFSGPSEDLKTLVKAMQEAEIAISETPDPQLVTDE